ncbi:hypothetical protein R1sor_006806 [Riccia sorocarpa]|uniref:Uncharacterized protein n=1 Tax=Riccia sorocarpa TaxID=122646 RepID=A0ABD3HSU4_9MARC
MADDGGHRAADEYEAPPRTENKRKFDDGPAEEPPSYSSGAPDADGPPVSYNNVPPPMSDFELAKERVQQIAAHIYWFRPEPPVTVPMAAGDNRDAELEEHDKQRQTSDPLPAPTGNDRL